MSKKLKALFAFSGVIVLLGSINSPVLLPYPLFVLTYLCGWRLPQIGTPAVRLLLATMLSTTILETGAWLDNYLKNAPAPILLHPQLIPDLMISIGIYAAWWLTWWLILRRYHFTVLQVFLTTGLYGVLLEQQGKVFLAGLAQFPLGVGLWLFVAVAYGSTMALAFFLVRDSFTAVRDGWFKYLLAWGGLFLLTLVTSIVWGLLLQGLNMIPPKLMPMREHPFW
ncbi:MAG: hypothetical protein PHQ40_16495 [Anaerolineaceae bacterium]|nr:hypothetical protein [Anaerolineaceae bacterium]